MLLSKRNIHLQAKIVDHYFERKIFDLAGHQSLWVFSTKRESKQILEFSFLASISISCENPFTGSSIWPGRYKWMFGAFSSKMPTRRAKYVYQSRNKSDSEGKRNLDMKFKILSVIYIKQVAANSRSVQQANPHSLLCSLLSELEHHRRKGRARTFHKLTDNIWLELMMWPVSLNWQMVRRDPWFQVKYSGTAFDLSC